MELKSGKFQIFRDETSGSEVLQHEQWTGIGGYFIFSWKAQWDCLLTEDPTRNMAYMLPRDKIPMVQCLGPSLEDVEFSKIPC